MGRAQTGQEYSVTERHSAVAVTVVLVVSEFTHQFVPCRFLRGCFGRRVVARVFTPVYISEVNRCVRIVQLRAVSGDTQFSVGLAVL